MSGNKRQMAVALAYRSHAYLSCILVNVIISKSIIIRYINKLNIIPLNITSFKNMGRKRLFSIRLEIFRIWAWPPKAKLAVAKIIF